MTIEQAKEILNEINPNGYCVGSGATDNDIDEAINIAIKSLDMWDKVTDELEELRYNGDFKITYSDCIKRVLDIIERYKKEIEE